MELKEFVEELKSRLDIVEVIGSYVSLQRVGKNYRALCPFHSEKTPSFYVNPERGFYHCFGCGASGDVIKFVQEIEQIDFMEAISKLANRAGMSLPSLSKKDVAYEAYTKLHEIFTEYYRLTLLSEKGREAFSYLTDARKLSRNDIEDFELGYAPRGLDSEIEGYLKKRGIALEFALKNGLLQRTESGYVHRFQGRVIFPIKNEQGRVVGFGGRIIGEGEPKYLNSRDSRFFRKSGLLYLFDRAKKAAKKTGFIAVAEGYFDAIALHRVGIKSAVAALTASLTSMHLSKIASVVDNLLLIFDADESGVKGARRAFEEIVKRNLSVVVVTLERGKDPDEILSKYGPETLQKELLNARPYEVFLASVERGGLDLTTVSGKEMYLRKTARWYKLLKESNPDRARRYLESVSGFVDWPNEDVEAFWKGQKSLEENVAVPQGKGAKKDAEDFLVKLFMSSSELREDALSVMEEFQDVLTDFGKQFYQVVRNDPEVSLNFLASKLSKDMVDRLFEDLDLEILPGREREILEDCKKRLERKKLEAEIDSLDRKLKDDSLSVQERSELLNKRVYLSKLLKRKG
ncbi:MAG: primase [Thermotogota bacterium]|nr:primase [Thermotogota bacterium]